MSDFISVNDLNTVDDLMEELARLLFLNPLLRHDEVKHFTSIKERVEV
jgi:hypothetical protein